MMGWIDEQLQENNDLTADILYERFGFRFVAGTGFDGLQAIAGPLCAATVILPPAHNLDLSYDLLKYKYEDLVVISNKIRDASSLLNLGWCNAAVMYRIGKPEAQKMCASTSFSRITEYNPISIVLVEGYEFVIPPLSMERARIPMYTCKKPCKNIEAIIAAKIVARAARETKMRILHGSFPEYEWNQNYGNLSNAHLEAIRTYGITHEHRDLSGIKALQGVPVFANKNIWRVQ
jgi:ribonuclease HII